MKKKLLVVFIFFLQHLNAQTLLTSMPETDNDVNAIYRWGNTVYIGGGFLNINASPKKYLASFDAVTGTVNSWNPAPNGEVKALAAAAGKLIVGGRFDTISQQPRNGICMYDLATGMLDSWSPTTNQNVYAIATYGTTFYFVGYGTGMNVYCVDAATGNYTGWMSQQPMTGLIAWALLRTDDYVYAGGDIDFFSSTIRDLCRFDAVTGVLDTSFHPANNLPSSDWITSLAQIDSNVYVGGSYTNIGGLPRNGISSFYPNGSITSFNPYCSNHQIFALFPSGNYIWLGGNSFVLGGFNRPRIAQVNTATQYATCWDGSSIPTSSWLWPLSIFVMGDTVYAGAESPSVNGRRFNVIINSPVPQLPDSVTGPVLVNQFQMATYSVPLHPGNTYYWNITGGTGSSTTNTINVTWGSGPAGTVTVVENNPSLAYCYSDTLTMNVTIQISTGTDNNELNNDIFISPNPSDGKIILHAGTLRSPFSVSVYNTLGERLFFENKTEVNEFFSLDFTTLNTGIYFLHLQSENNNLYKRFVIER